MSFASLVLGLSNGKERTHSLQKTAIVGFGAFGHLIAERLRSRVIYPSPEAQAAALRLGLPVCALSDVAHCEWVVLAVPLSALRHVLTDLVRIVRPGTLVMGMVSIREEPAKLMRKLVPPDVGILATLPFFGPQSAAARLSLFVQSAEPNGGTWPQSCGAQGFA